MGFWGEVGAGLLANVLAAAVITVIYILVQWFLTLTDVAIFYNWRFNGDVNTPRDVRPNLRIENRSASKTYYVSNIAYLSSKRPVAPFDNESLWGTELKPGSVTNRVPAAIKKDFNSAAEMLATQVHVRLQSGRLFWLQGIGPGQGKKAITSRVQRWAFSLRDWFDKRGFPLE